MSDNRAVHIISLLQRLLGVFDGVLQALVAIKSDTAAILIGVNRIQGDTSAAVTALNNIITLINNSNTNQANIVNILNTISAELQNVKNNLDTLLQQGTDTYNSLLTLINRVESLKVSQDVFYATILKYEDNPVSSGDAGIQLLTQRQDTLAVSTSANGDYQPLKTNDAGALYVTDVNLVSNVSNKKQRILGASNTTISLTYVGSTTKVNTITYTATTGLGVETLTETYTYDLNDRVTNIVYS